MEEARGEIRRNKMEGLGNTYTYYKATVAEKDHAKTETERMMQRDSERCTKKQKLVSRV